jgi:hypothetical protein
MAGKKQNFLDTGKYCTHLTEPPIANREYHYLCGCNLDKDFYVCGITNKQCIARESKETTTPCDLVRYHKPFINEDLLKNCPTRNISSKIADMIRKDIIKREIKKLEEKIKCQ